MAHVVFLRGVNVGSAKRFLPSSLARELAHLEAVNLGAAGTFIIPKRMGHAALRAEFESRLPFSADLMICGGQEILDLAAANPFPNPTADSTIRRFVSVLAKRPANRPRLPFSFPPGSDWQVRVVGASGILVWAVWRRLGQRSFVDPNSVIEKHFGVRATTRNWNTVLRLCHLLHQAESRAKQPISSPRRDKG